VTAAESRQWARDKIRGARAEGAPISSPGTEGAQRLRLRRAADVAVVESADTGQRNDAAALW